MEYRETIDEINKIIKVEVSGEVGENDAFSLGVLFRTKAMEENYKLFFDIRKTTTKISLASAYFWYERKYSEFSHKFKYIPTVYLTNKEQENFYSFVQTISYNQGINLRVFHDEQEGFNHLLNESLEIF